LASPGDVERRQTSPLSFLSLMLAHDDFRPLDEVTDLSAAILLAGPGGAGKTTIGGRLARRLGVPFLDLDEQFTARYGDISRYLARLGYPSYAARNVQLLIDLVAPPVPMTVIALSSGFMTYPADVHPAYDTLRRAIVMHPATAVLLPSFDLEACVAETVRRQLQRPFGNRGAGREEEVIRHRFGLHRAITVPQFETTRSVEAIVEDLQAHANRVVAGPRR
jgi:shikimate kinase